MDSGCEDPPCRHTANPRVRGGAAVRGQVHGTESCWPDAQGCPGLGAVEHASESNKLDPETWSLLKLHRDCRAGYAVSGAASIHGAEKVPCRPPHPTPVLETLQESSSSLTGQGVTPTPGGSQPQPSTPRFFHWPQLRQTPGSSPLPPCSGGRGPWDLPSFSPWLRTAGQQSPTTDHTTSLSLGDLQGQGPRLFPPLYVFIFNSH